MTLQYSVAQEALTLTTIFETWSTEFQYQIAFNRTQTDTLILHQIPSHKSPEEAFSYIEDEFGLCFQKVGEGMYLVHKCAAVSWDILTRITDIENTEGLPFASVRIIDSGVVLVADGSGSFSISGILQDEITLLVSYVGYRSDTIVVRQPEKNNPISLKINSFELENVEVQALREVIKSSGHFSNLALETEVLKSFPSIMGPDPLSMLRLLPGVAGNPESGPGLVLRGSKFDQTMLLFDGIQLLQQNHFFGLFSSLNYKSIKDIRILRSGYSAKYSGYAGGLVNISSKQGDFAKFHGGFEVDRFTTATHFLFPVIKEKWSTAITFRFDNSWSGPDQWNEIVAGSLIEQRISASNNGVRSVAGRDAFYFLQDFTINSTLKTKGNGQWTLSVQNSQDQVSNNFTFRDEPQEYSLDLDYASFWSNTGLAIDYTSWNRANWKTSFNISSSLFFSSTEFDKLFEVNSPDTLHDLRDYRQENTLSQFRVRYDMEKTFASGNSWSFGVDAPGYNSMLDLIFQSDTAKFSQDYFVPSVYFERGWVKKAWNIKFGLRNSWDFTFGRLRIEPRLSIQKPLQHQLKLRFNYGYYLQYAQQHLPDIREGLVPQYWLLPDDSTTRVLSSHLLSLGISKQMSSWFFDLEAYYKKIKGTAEQFPSLEELYPGTSNSLAAVVSGESAVVGSDLLISKRYRRMTLWSGFDWTMTRNESASITTGDYQPYYVNTVNVKLGSLFTLRHLDLGLNWQWQGGRKLTLLSELVPLKDVEVANTILDDYHRLDASITYKFEGRKFRGTIQNSFFNLYNRKNIKSIRQVRGSDGLIKNVNSYHLGFLYNLKFSLAF